MSTIGDLLVFEPLLSLTEKDQIISQVRHAMVKRGRFGVVWNLPSYEIPIKHVVRR